MLANCVFGDDTLGFRVSNDCHLDFPKGGKPEGGFLLSLKRYPWNSYFFVARGYLKIPRPAALGTQDSVPKGTWPSCQ